MMALNATSHLSRSPLPHSHRDRQVAVECEAGGFVDVDVEDLAGVAVRVAFEDDDFVVRGAAGEALGVVLRGAFAEDLLARADEGCVFFDGDAVDHFEEALIA